jgi:hypothetical protein
MTRAIGLNAQTAYKADAESILLGAVGKWDDRAATTRDGSALELPYRLNRLPMFKVVGYGATSSAAGGYLVKAAHFARGAAVGDVAAANWVTIGTIVFNGEGPVEFGLTGPEVERLVEAGTSPAITGDVRVKGVKLFPGSGNLSISNVALTDNVATVTVGTHTLQVGEVVTANCSNAVFTGTHVITAVAATTISFAKTNANVSSASATGTVTNGVAVPAGAGNGIQLHPAR